MAERYEPKTASERLAWESGAAETVQRIAEWLRLSAPAVGPLALADLIEQRAYLNG